MGLTDTMAIQTDEVLTGTYYERKPILPRDSGLPFKYDIIDESDKSYATLLNNLQSEMMVQTIKTKDKIEFKIKSFIVTQDGILWQISGIIKKLKHENTRQALRITRETVQTTRIIRLIAVENPMDLQ